MQLVSQCSGGRVGSPKKKLAASATVMTLLAASCIAEAWAEPVPRAAESAVASDSARTLAPEGEGSSSTSGDVESSQGAADRNSAEVSSELSPQAQAARFASLDPKFWATTFPSFGTGALGDAGGVRSALADKGIGASAFFIGAAEKNLLNTPRSINGRQTYIGQRYSDTQLLGLWGTYDLGRVGLEGGQVFFDVACQASSYYPFSGGRGCRLAALTYYQPIIPGKVSVNLGVVANDTIYMTTQIGGVIAAGTFGPAASLPSQAGLSAQPFGKPGINFLISLDDAWYVKVGLQQSLSPQGLLVETKEYNPHGLDFSIPGARSLAISELGFRQAATPERGATFFRMGGLNNWSNYYNFNTGKTSDNSMVYVMHDQQLSQSNASVMPFQGWYGGFSAMRSPSNVNVFKSYYEARLYNIGGLFPSRPFDIFSVVVTHSDFSDSASRFYQRLGYLTRDYTTSLTASYAYQLAPNFYLASGLGYTKNPTYTWAPGEGNSLNAALSLSIFL